MNKLWPIGGVLLLWVGFVYFLARWLRFNTQSPPPLEPRRRDSENGASSPPSVPPTTSPDQ